MKHCTYATDTETTSSNQSSVLVDPKVAGDAGGLITKVFISLKFSICYTDLKVSPCILRALNRNSSQPLLFHTFRAKTRTLESH